MKMNPYLTFGGDCEAAFKFYEKTLGGTIEAMFTHEDTPMADEVPADWRKKIMHASLKVGGGLLMGSDAPAPSRDALAGFSVSLQIEDPAEAERVFQALAANGTVKMPIQETFWALRFGMLVDQFGVPWMVNCDRPEA